MKNTQHRSSLFLLELIIDLFLFVVCAAVCVGVLLHARGVSMESTDLTEAVSQAQTIAEEWRATGAQPMWGPPDESGLTGSFSTQGDALTISIYKGDKLIYALEGVTRDG